MITYKKLIFDFYLLNILFMQVKDAERINITVTTKATVEKYIN
jgi:hypothetical protein